METISKKYNCIHGKRKSQCRDCGGSAFCEHGKFKSTCRDCGGSAFCEHSKFKSHCRDCGGSSFCEHGKEKSRCIDCGGSQICEHGKDKRYCKYCGGSALCEHGKRKSTCRDCEGSAFCQHGKQKSRCRDCEGSGFCEHGKFKSICKDCGGSQICKHVKDKRYCKPCGGSALCKSSWCETIGNKKYDGFCMNCFIHLFPDNEIVRNYKTKEKAVSEKILEAFPDFTWISDKRIVDGCSRRRPDFLLDMGSHIVIVEVDENQHQDYDCSCENKRLMEISQDLGHRPVVFIRFNPDEYETSDGVKITSCWNYDKKGNMKVKKSKEREWKERLDILIQQIRYWIDNPTEKTIEIIQLFYSIKPIWLEF